jgi:hypothetical protein
MHFAAKGRIVMSAREALRSEFSSQVTQLLEVPSEAVRFELLHQWVVNLERLIFEMDAFEALSRELLNELSAEQRQQLNRAYCVWETELEKQFVSGNSSRLRVEKYLLNTRFDHLVHKEIELLGEFTPERVLFIGSGPFPISAIHYQRKLKMPVHCLEKEPSALAISNQAIHELSLHTRIFVHRGHGEDFAVGNYDLIIIALLAKPKKLILANILKHGAPACRVICRTSERLRTILYEPTMGNTDTAAFSVQGMQSAGPGDTISSFLLRKTLVQHQDVGVVAAPGLVSAAVS